MTGANPLVHRGEANPKAKLTAEKVRQIRADKRPNKVVAREMNVGQYAIRDIRAGRTWKHVA